MTCLACLSKLVWACLTSILSLDFVLFIINSDFDKDRKKKEKFGNSKPRHFQRKWLRQKPVTSRRNLILVWILPGISEQGPNKNTIPHPSLHAEDIFEDLYVYLLGDGYHLGLIQKDIQGDFY